MTGFKSKREAAQAGSVTKDEALNLEVLERLMYTFEKDGKFTMTSCIRNELFQEATNSLNQVKEALAQPEQPAQQKPIEKNMTLACPSYLHDYTTPPKAEQEPVAYVVALDGQPISMTVPVNCLDKLSALHNAPLYTTPPKRQPLTDGEIWDLHIKMSAALNCKLSDLIELTRAVEAAHGIKE